MNYILPLHNEKIIDYWISGNILRNRKKIYIRGKIKAGRKQVKLH